MYFKIINQYEKDNTTEEQVNDKKKNKQITEEENSRAN